MHLETLKTECLLSFLDALDANNEILARKKLTKIPTSDIRAHDWVKVVYEGEVFSRNSAGIKGRSMSGSMLKNSLWYPRITKTRE